MEKSLTRIDAPSRAEVDSEVRRLVESPGLQHAESLCQLLRYLVSQAIEKPQEHVKEYQIALDVFGRPENFDPRLDSTIRVQTSRLRNKLVEYYATLGASDPIVIEIPRGTYSPVFHVRRAPVSPGDVHPVPVETLPVKTVVPRDRSWFRRALPWTVAALAVLAAIAVSTYARRGGKPVAPTVDHSETATFWSSVLKNPSAPLVVFSNAEFVGRPETGLRYFNPKTDSREHIEDLYTGVGETLAIGELSDLFRDLKRRMVVKRSALLSWDETRDRDLIFAGSPTENLSLRDLPLSREFIFRPMNRTEPRPGDLAIVNEHPRTGEPKLFYATATLPLTEDYALVTLQPGLHPGQNALLLLLLCHKT